MIISVKKGGYLLINKRELTEEKLANLKELARLARGDILKMTTLAKCGHPGGSMSSIDIYLVLYSFANVSPKYPDDPDRDRIIISHGHTSPGVYSALGRLGFFNIDYAISGFRKAGSIFDGHVDWKVPGVEWSSGNLGQGLSAGCGFALSGKLLNKDFHTFVVMSDGEQQKGQVSEARRFAKKYNLNELTVIIDYNGLQISGKITDVMPQNIKGNFISDGWKVLEIDGHDHKQIYEALKKSVNTKDTPIAIFAYTKMGKDVSFMEDDEQFHGKALSIEQYKRAITELNIDNDLDKYYKLRQKIIPIKRKGDIPLKERVKKIEKELKRTYKININFGRPKTYYKEDKLDNRTAFGNVMKEFAELNCKGSSLTTSSITSVTPIAVFDCDLATSVRTDKFASICPNNYFEGGIQEHNTATISGALSTQNVLTFFADFGVFGIDETYNQQRLNDINQTNLKLITTHCGLNVGEDGKTHHCIDYLGVMRNLHYFNIIIPADPNQTDRIVRYISKNSGNFLVAMGRTKVPVILKNDEIPYFTDDYKFEYGKADLIRGGDKATIISMGFMLHRAIEAWEILKNKGYSVRVLNVSCPTKLDEKAIDDCIDTGPIVTYEDHNVQTGLGSIVADYIAQSGKRVRFKKMGISSYGLSGAPEDLFEIQGLSIENLVNSLIREIERKD